MKKNVLLLAIFMFLISCTGVTRNLSRIPKSIKKVAIASAVCDLKIGTVSVESSKEGAEVEFLSITSIQKKNIENFSLNPSEENFLNENGLNIVNSYKNMLNYEIVSLTSLPFSEEKRKDYFALDGYFDVKEDNCQKLSKELQVDGLFFIKFKMYRGFINNLFFGKKYYICLKTTIDFYDKNGKKLYENISYSYSENYKNVRLPYFFKLDERNKKVYEEAFIKEFDKMEKRAVKRMKNFDKKNSSLKMKEYDDF